MNAHALVAPVHNVEIERMTAELARLARAAVIVAERVWTLSEARAAFKIPDNLAQSDTSAIDALSHQNEDADTAPDATAMVRPALFGSSAQ